MSVKMSEPVWFPGFCVLLLWLSAASSYNLDTEHKLLYRGPHGAFFGFSVLQHQHDNTHWILVGAPRSNSTFSSSVKSPGAVLKCRVRSNPEHRCTEMDLGRGNKRRESCGKTCQADREDEWMGISLARQDGTGGKVLACAHRWKNVFYESEQILPHGYCSVISPSLQGHTRALIPCYEAYKKTYGEEHGSCQAGIAGVFTEELIVMGAPGSYYWTGTVKVLNLTSGSYYSLDKGAASSERYSYLGYAVTAGHFSSATATDIVGGAPRDGGGGKVGVAVIARRCLLSTGKMGSYFGSSLCAVDLNQDGLSDLLVGAPMHSELRDEGQVVVYLNRGSGLMEEMGVLTGDRAYDAHFGECIASLGDIDDDGYQDVAIGAPKEDDYAGAVYIYHGDVDGVIGIYSTKLSGRRIHPSLRMFGQSISGGVDMDRNGYPDVTVGAFMSDNVVMLWSRPVITVDVSIFLPPSISITAPECSDSSQHLNCLNVTLCLRFHGKQVPGQIELLYNLTADVEKRSKSQQTRVLFALNGDLMGTVSGVVHLLSGKEACQTYVKEVKDVFSPIVFEAAYGLGRHVVEEPQDRELPQLSPVLRWRKGDRMAQRNKTWFEKNCLSDDCAADLRLQGQLLLPSTSMETAVRPYLALGGVRNISLNLSISNAGDDAYDTNIFFNFSRELYFIKMWQKEEKGISCELAEPDFLRCSVGFPFMRAQTTYHLAVIFDTSRLSGENDTLRFRVSAQSANPEHDSKLADNTLELSIPLVHEVDTTITGTVTPASFIYGNSMDPARFVQLDDMECSFQPLNLTFQVINNGPSRLPAATVDVRIPNRLVGSGADMLFPLPQVAGDRGNCTSHNNPMPCTVPQDRESIFHTIFAFFTKSGRRVLDCDRPGRSCLMITCAIGSLSKEESASVDMRILLNTELLKRDSSSVIQLVSRAGVRVDPVAVEVPSGLPEDVSVVFEALHNQEPRGYVVGWIIAISLLVGILIFLLLAVLLWKMGFFRRRYKEIIEAEKSRKDSDESWDWVQRSQ
uniref:Integrin, alpha 9 n=1 Tax=Scleropages formosus TaxID=113540 RepID=A0A8C9VL98_SCLFO